MSNRAVSRRKWRTAIIVMTLICIGGLALIFALTLGAANPPHAPRLTLDTTAPAPSNPLPAPPYTLELSATNSGQADSAWGFWIGADGATAQVFLVDGHGYLSIAHGAERDWSQFIHLKPQTNALYLNVEANGTATFRINGEIAWRGTMASVPENHWGIASDGQAQLIWKFVRVFAS